MPFRQIDTPLLGRRMSNVMAGPSSAEPDTHGAGLDEYLRLGGNCIHLHGEGGETHSRRAAGQWLRRKGVRPEFFVCTRICHEGWDQTAHRAIERFTADGVREDVANDLDLLATEYLDLVYLDDSPQMLLEPVVEAVSREITDGRVRAFGVRNWTAERIAAANAHLFHKGLPGIAAILTTELALAACTEPLWPEYVPFGADLRRLVCDLRLTVFAHAADLNIGQSLFADSDATSRMRRRWIERWDHPTNPGLVQRVQGFAAARGLTPREVNVAWMLNQPFPVVAIVSLPLLLTSCRDEYSGASQLLLHESDLDFLSVGLNGDRLTTSAT